MRKMYVGAAVLFVAGIAGMAFGQSCPPMGPVDPRGCPNRQGTVCYVDVKKFNPPPGHQPIEIKANTESITFCVQPTDPDFAMSMVQVDCANPNPSRPMSMPIYPFVMTMPNVYGKIHASSAGNPQALYDPNTNKPCFEAVAAFADGTKTDPHIIVKGTSKPRKVTLTSNNFCPQPSAHPSRGCPSRHHGVCYVDHEWLAKQDPHAAHAGFELAHGAESITFCTLTGKDFTVDDFKEVDCDHPDQDVTGSTLYPFISKLSNAPGQRHSSDVAANFPDDNDHCFRTMLTDAASAGSGAAIDPHIIVKGGNVKIKPPEKKEKDKEGKAHSSAASPKK